MRGHDMLREEKTQTDSLPVRLRGRERIEEVSQDLGAHPAPRVRDNNRVRAGTILDANADESLRGRVNRIVKEGDDHLLDLEGVDLRQRGDFSQLDLEGHAFLPLPPKLFDRGCGDGSQVGLDRVDVATLRKAQQLADDLCRAASLRADRVQLVASHRTSASV